MPVQIMNVAPGTPAAKAGVRKGDLLLAAGGRQVKDVLDYGFYTLQDPVTLTISRGGQQMELQLVRKRDGEDLGLLFDDFLMDNQHSCQNHCVFCFVDQLPAGLRAPLYFKDDDERLSFLFGNYITLTNLSEQEAKRICEMRISPMNISVHTTDPALRRRMMGNPKAGDSLRYLDWFKEAGIAMNAQIVLCRGLNDGAALDKTIGDLARYTPQLQSLAVVPVGLTKWREKRYPLKPFDAASAGQVLDQLLAAGDAFLQTLGTRLVFPADEWFLLAGRPVPEAAFYEEYVQLENGVGMWRLLYDEFKEALDAEPVSEKAICCDLATGEAAFGLLSRLADMAMAKFSGLSVRVHCVKNHFFGGNVTVSGLLTGQDIIGQLQGQLTSQRLLLPANVLRSEGDLLLDDTTPHQLEQALQTAITFVPLDGNGLLQAMLGGENEVKNVYDKEQC